MTLEIYIYESINCLFFLINRVQKLQKRRIIQTGMHAHQMIENIEYN